MNDLWKDLTAIALAVVGVAVLTVLVRNSSNTTGVIKAASSGFQSILTAAMGGASVVSN